MRERLFQTATGLLAWAALSIQLWLMLSSPAFATAGEAVWRYLSYFTILTNLLIAFRTTLSLAPVPGRLRMLAEAAPTRAALLLSISLVAVVYHLLLAHRWSPQGWQLLADILMHTVIPLMVVADWIVFAPKSTLSGKHLPLFLAWPSAYSAYSLVRGHFDGHYPYEFLNPARLGYGPVALNLAGIALGFITGALILIRVSGLLEAGLRRRRQAP